MVLDDPVIGWLLAYRAIPIGSSLGPSKGLHHHLRCRQVEHIKGPLTTRLSLTHLFSFFPHAPHLPLFSFSVLLSVLLCLLFCALLALLRSVCLYP